jgi:hypothetical protein
MWPQLIQVCCSIEVALPLSFYFWLVSPCMSEKQRRRHWNQAQTYKQNAQFYESFIKPCVLRHFFSSYRCHFLELANLGRLHARTSLKLSRPLLVWDSLRRVAAGEWVRVILKFSLGAWNIKTGPALTFIELADAQSVSEGAWRAQYRRIWVCSAVETAVLMCALSAWRVGLAPVSLVNCADKVKLKALPALWLRAEPQKEIFPFSQHTT